VNRRGFTLLELLVVIAIIGILSAMATVSFTEVVARYKIMGQAESIRSFLVQADSEARKTKTAWSIEIDTSATILKMHNSGNCSGGVLHTLVFENALEVMPFSKSTPAPAAAQTGLTESWSTSPLPGCIHFNPRLVASSLDTAGYFEIWIQTNQNFRAIIYKTATDNQPRSSYTTNGGTTWTRQ